MIGGCCRLTGFSKYIGCTSEVRRAIEGCWAVEDLLDRGRRL